MVKIFKETFPKAMEVLKRTITKIGQKDWSEILTKLQNLTKESVMEHWTLIDVFCFYWNGCYQLYLFQYNRYL